MAKIKAKQIDLTGINTDSGVGVRKRIPVGITLTVADGFQYVVHANEFPIYGTLVLQGDSDLIVINT